MNKPIRIDINEKNSRNKIPTNRLNIGLMIVLIIISIVAVYLYLQYSEAKQEADTLKDPDKYANLLEDESKKVLEKLEKHVLLPDEDPRMYSILDVDEAKESYGDFFDNAQNGDRLFIYENKAIIYREDADIVINMGPIMYLPSQSNTDEDQ